MPFACIFVPDFPAEAILRAEPELRSQAVAVLEGKPPLQRVFAVNEKARQAGVSLGMTKIQVEPWTELALRLRSPLRENAAHAALLDCAQSFSPRVEDTASNTVILDLSGLESLFGPLPRIAHAIARRISDLGLEANVAIASNPDTARFAARGFAGVTIVPEGKEAEPLGDLPLDVLFPELSALAEQNAQFLETFALWGVRNLRALCALPEVALSERLGQPGVRLQQLARGAISRTLVPVEPPLGFEEAIELEHPLVLLEPLAFLLARMLDQLCARLAARALAAQELGLQLTLDQGFHFVEDIPAEEWNANENSQFINTNFPCHPERSEAPAERSKGSKHIAGNATKPGAATTTRSPLAHAQLTNCHSERGVFEQCENRAKDLSDRPRRDPASGGIATSPTRASLFTRTLQLPLPMLDAKIFLKLLQLDLKAHPPGAPILKIHLSATPALPRTAQGGLFLPPIPEPEKLEFTLARIAGMVGEDKVGSMQLLDSHRPGAFRMQRFVPAEPQGQKANHGFSQAPITALRIFRPPLCAIVTLRDGQPAHLACPKRKEVQGDILWMAGPWRSSGDWWEQDGWARDEWDIAIQTPVVGRRPWAEGNTMAEKFSLALYRLVHDLLDGHWFVEGTYD